jgi:hypothetical protein
MIESEFFGMENRRYLASSEISLFLLFLLRVDGVYKCDPTKTVASPIPWVVNILFSEPMVHGGIMRGLLHVVRLGMIHSY